MPTQPVTDQSFAQDVLQSEKPVIVEFWAPWCGSCKTLTPIIDEIAHAYGDKVTVATVDIDANPEIATQFGILSLPSMLVFRGGERVKAVVGVKKKAELISEFSDLWS
ncbi:thioredoxin [Rhodococcus sp. NPDC057014]|uniref:thioredoxin n=1 Tax=unclassified Rhodococcus (in: high G+C Gram-positive bacteria) TaxID=192944 RepID=UPI0023E151CB|nr:thioredoxin [Rhodococcus sp. T2V]MDF3311874.1 thioredoxin [Rhodococcus sp. T2V]